MARGSAAQSRRSARPAWVRLGVLLAIAVVMYGSMALMGHLTPKLGLDLQGGTSVILTPRSTQAGKGVDSGAVNKAVDIIRQRVNGLGVSEAEVKRNGNQIEISVPGKGRNDVVNLVGQTAELRFRQVATAAAATAAPAPTPTGSPAPTPTGSPTPTPTGSPTAAPSGAAATPTPAAAGATTPALTTATPTATTRPDVVGSGLLAAAAPSATTSVAPVATATPAATANQAAAAAAAAQAPVDVQADFASLTCPQTKKGNQAAGTDSAASWVVACDRDNTTKYLLMPATVIGTDVASADAGLSSSGGTTTVTTGEWIVNVNFTKKGQGKFTSLTEKTIGQQVAIVLDGVVQSAPTTDTRIAGSAQISGSFTQSSAQDLANVLRYGALPLAFEQNSADSISPTLGKDSLNAGLLAGALGFVLVILYAFLYYRALGVVVITSLVASGLLIYGSVVLLGQWIGFTLTLAGIAGLIVSIGVTADSFVVYFERIKDEVRAGRSVRVAVDRAWLSARRTVLSADTVSFLAAAVLYVLSVGSVKGFAFTLGLSTLTDVLILFIFTKPLVMLLVRRKLFGASKFSGLTVEAVGSAAAIPTAPPPRSRLAKREPTAVASGDGAASRGSTPDRPRRRPPTSGSGTGQES